MSSGWTSAARSPMPSSTTTPAPSSRRSRPSTPPDYSRGVLDVLGLLAEQLGRPLAGDAGRHPPHRPRHHVVAERAGHGQRAAGRLPHHQGPPRLDLHHERRGPLPRPLAARAAARARRSPSSTACSPSGTRWRSPSGSTATATSSSPSTRTTPAAAIRRAARRRGARDRGVAAVVVPQPGARAAAARAGRARSTRTCSSRCRREVSPRIREFARNATTIMSTQIGPGLRDYLVRAGGRAARARAGRSAAGHAVQRRRRRRRTRRRPPRSARSGRCSPAVSSDRSRWAASSATATSSPPTSAAPRSSPGWSSTASRCAPPPR